MPTMVCTLNGLRDKVHPLGRGSCALCSSRDNGDAAAKRCSLIELVSRSSVFPLSNLDSGGNRARPSQGLHPRRSRNKQRMGTALREVDGIRIQHDGCLRNMRESQYQSTGNRENRSQDRETVARRRGTPVQGLFPQRRGSLLARHVPSYSAFCFFPIGNNCLSTS